MQFNAVLLWVTASFVMVGAVMLLLQPLIDIR